MLERSARVGGRVGTDLVDGFRCDLGLSWFDAAHPVLREALDVAALNPRGIPGAAASGRRAARAVARDLDVDLE